MEALAKRFNTDDGIWRATMAISQYSIPSGRGEFQYRERYVEGCNILQRERGTGPTEVSIPRTVCGGLQYRS